MKQRKKFVFGTKAKVGSAALVTASLVFGGATAAHAEGNFTSYMTQVQPTFYSRDWTDNNRDATSTVITLSHCKVNKGGARVGSTKLSSVEIWLHYGDAYTKPKKIKKSCGTYNFGRISGRDTGNSFEIHAINGITDRGAKIFLNADVKVVY
ncbi:hypothetical protein [Curtobacterium aetherium]|uniref:Uncharacterized protein n=1 Tax=Curtobacterium aetherium TaxID=2841594 RepID=A0ACD1E3I0_9MICO|nr:hypothetical protein [Curtobacterium sp. L6-1]QWS33242.1 hypothetical protein KM842_13505 [Curtobacterium sp. L6-1]